jgi:hypothetical protein
MSKGYLIINLRRIGTRNLRNIPPKTVYIVLLDDVANGSSLEISTRRMARSMGSAVVVRQRSVAFAMVNGMAQRIVPRMRRPTGFSKQQNRQVGNDVTIAGLWSSLKKAAIT